MNIKPIERIEHIRSTDNLIKQYKGQQEYINDIQAVKGDVILYNQKGNKWNYQVKRSLGYS